MKKNLLSIAVAASAAGMASVATAQMYINPERTGEALLFPFYSAQSGNTTAIHIVNTTNQYKAVKVKIIEGYESFETRDFNLYMSPEDHFSFGIVEDGDGAKLVTGDTSCTVPAIPAAGVPFTDQLWATADQEDREQVGYVEIIEMGQIDPDTATAAAILHKDGVPKDCSLVVEHWSVVDDVPGPWRAEADGTSDSGATTTGVTHMLADWAGGGLYGVANVINVKEGTSFGYDAVAIEDLVDPAASGAALHYSPEDLRPNWADPSLDRNATVVVNGEQVAFTAYDADSHEAVSALFMTETISNDYVIDEDVNALTDWIVTMPTKRNHKAGKSTLFTKPFSNQTIDALTNKASATGLCQPVSMVGYDREEGTQAPPPPPEGENIDPLFSPSVTPTPETPESVPDYALCAESSVLHFGAASATNTVGVGATGKENLSSVGVFVDGWSEGWAVLGLTEAGLINGVDNARELDGLNGATLYGLPATGFAVVEYTNGANPDGLSNYQLAWEHKTSVASSSAD
jgi:hypothetical protein